MIPTEFCSFRLLRAPTVCIHQVSVRETTYSYGVDGRKMRLGIDEQKWLVAIYGDGESGLCQMVTCQFGKTSGSFRHRDKTSPFTRVLLAIHSIPDTTQGGKGI